MARTDGGDAEALDVETGVMPETGAPPGPAGRNRNAVRPVMEYVTVWFAAAMLLVVIVYYAKPQWQLPVWATLGLSCSVAAFVGSRLNHPDRRLPWYLLAAAMFTLINGDTIYNILTDVFHQNEPFPSAADASYLFTYPLAAGGIIMMIRLRNPARDVTALVDALLLASGLTLIIWVFIITPTVDQKSVPWFNSAVSVGYPIGDVLLLVVILRLLTGGVNGLSAILLVVGSLGLMTSDIAYLTVRLYGTWHVGSPADLGWVVFYISWACAALHPSMIDLTRPNLRSSPLATGRVFPLALTALVAPALLLFEALARSLHDAPVIAVFSAVMFILVIIRLSLQSRQLRRQESVAQSRAMLRELRNRAYHDALTGLANRAKFQERAERAFGRVRESGGEVCMLLIDLDNFKEVNDTLGHRAGDELLRAAAGRLKAAVRPGDLAARFGGDEFAVLLADGSPPEGAEALAARLIRTFSAPFLIWDAQADVRASIGVATSADAPLVADEGEDFADILLRNADLALYEAKADGKAIWRRYQPQLYEAAMERMRLRTSLDQAIEREEVFLAYQPIVRLRGPLRVAGFEALVRWRHPELGLLPPDQFIPLAEETGQIVALGAWVLGRAIADAAAWNAGRAPEETRHVTVNVSAHQFLEDGMVDEIKRKLTSEGLPAKLLILEITETAFLHHHGPEVSRNLNALSALGVRIAVDDFGTGYSSIAYLRDLSIHILKADKSFVDRIAEEHDHLALLQGIVTVASALGIDVVAEGVETEQQQQLLRKMGCSFGQGYLYSPAVPIDRVAAITAQVEGRER